MFSPFSLVLTWTTVFSLAGWWSSGKPCFSTDKAAVFLPRFKHEVRETSFVAEHAINSITRAPLTSFWYYFALYISSVICIARNTSVFHLTGKSQWSQRARRWHRQRSVRSLLRQCRRLQWRRRSEQRRRRGIAGWWRRRWWWRRRLEQVAQYQQAKTCCSQHRHGEHTGWCCWPHRRGGSRTVSNTCLRLLLVETLSGTTQTCIAQIILDRYLMTAHQGRAVIACLTPP